MSKTYRHEHILKLVRARAVRSQHELAEALHRAGIETTQVTLSRDLKELGLVKTPEGYVVMESAGAPVAAQDLGHIAREFVRDLRPAQNLLVVKTDPGAAPTVAAVLDAEAWGEISGSLAGDDTVLLVCPTPRRRAAVEQRLRAMIAS